MRNIHVFVHTDELQRRRYDTHMRIYGGKLRWMWRFCYMHYSRLYFFFQLFNRSRLDIDAIARIQLTYEDGGERTGCSLASYEPNTIVKRECGDQMEMSSPIGLCSLALHANGFE